MPAKSKSQQRLFSMALAVRKGDLSRSKVWKAVLDIVDSNMTNKEIEDFTVLKESKQHIKPLFDYINETLKRLDLGDLAEKNLGETEDGRIVLMDF